MTVPVLRLSQSSGAGLHRVEIAVEMPGMARRTATARFAFGVPPDEQELIRWYFEDYRKGPADLATGLRAGRAERRLGELGDRLFLAVFGASQDTRALWAAVQPELAAFRVEIVTNVAGATALPWEMMTDPRTGQPLALHAAALVRAHPQAARAPELPEDDGTVRVLLVISRPGVIDVPFLSVAHHLARLQEGHRRSVRLEVLRPPTFAQLTRTLQAAKGRGKPYQVVHFDGHGVWGDVADGPWLQTVIPAAGSRQADRWLVSPGRPGAHGYLEFENPLVAGNVQLADGPTLGNLLTDAGVPLLVLNACRSALGDTPPASTAAADPHAHVRAYGSLAQEVMDSGVAAVLAMRYDVYVVTAARFVADLYAGVVRGQSFGAAVRAARQNLASSRPDGVGVNVSDWMVPVAYEAAPLHLIGESAGADREKARPGPAGGAGPGGALPARSDLGFFGRDHALLALDRAFDSGSFVLLHGEAGIGKTATAAEFARWYQLTCDAPRPVAYTSMSGRGAVADVAAQLMRLQLVGQVPLLWIWDDLGPEATGPELLSLVRAARDTKAKLLLISRDDQRTWLGDLPVRLQLPPLPLEERNLLVRAVAARRQVEIAGLGPTSAALRSMGGNPRIIIGLTEEALRAGCVSGAGLATFVRTADTATQEKGRGLG